MGTDTQGTVDSLDFSELWQDSVGTGVKVTLTVPTQVADTQAAASATELKNLIAQAKQRLADSEVPRARADAILQPAADLVADSSYWRVQSRGLIIFAAEDFFRAVRIPVRVRAAAAVGERFHVLPIADVLSTGGRCYILALAKNRVRLFDSSRNAIAELPLGEIPESFDAVVQEQFQPNLQGRSVGGNGVMYHGQGDNSDVVQRQTEDFIAAVGKGVAATLGTARSQPLVLAAVSEYLPAFRSACAYPVIHDEVIPGNPERTDPDRLRSAAWELLEDSARAEDDEIRDRAMSRVFAGKGSLDPAEIARAAAEGRVEALYLPTDPVEHFDAETAGLLDAAVLDLERGAGEVRTLARWDEKEPIVAAFRY